MMHCHRNLAAGQGCDQHTYFSRTLIGQFSGKFLHCFVVTGSVQCMCSIYICTKEAPIGQSCSMHTNTICIMRQTFSQLHHNDRQTSQKFIKTRSREQNLNLKKLKSTSSKLKQVNEKHRILCLATLGLLFKTQVLMTGGIFLQGHGVDFFGVKFCQFL